MRKYGRVDANHTAIIAALRKVGITAFSIASIGNGKGDIVAGWNGRNVLLEVKNPKQKPSKQRLTKDEIKHHREWNGQIAVVKTAEEAIAAVLGRLREACSAPDSLDKLRGVVKRHSLDRLASFVDAIVGKRLTYERLIAEVSA